MSDRSLLSALLLAQLSAWRLAKFSAVVSAHLLGTQLLLAQLLALLLAPLLLAPLLFAQLRFAQLLLAQLLLAQHSSPPNRHIPTSLVTTQWSRGGVAMMMARVTAYELRLFSTHR